MIGLAVASCVIAALFRPSKGPWEVLCIFATAVLVAIGALQGLDKVFDFVRRLADSSGIQSDYASIIFKVLGICFLGDFAISVCNDRHYSSLSSMLDIFCKITVLVLALPILNDIIDILEDLLC